METRGERLEVADVYCLGESLPTVWHAVEVVRRCGYPLAEVGLVCGCFKDWEVLTE